MPTLKKDITQRQLEAFEEALRDQSPDGHVANIQGIAKFTGVVVRAAARSGWFEKELTDDEVGDMTAVAVKKISDQTYEMYSDMVHLSE